MKKANKKFIFIFVSLSVFLVLIFWGCKKLDLVRIAAVHTELVDNITANQAVVYGKIIDLGESNNADDYGFCWAINRSPTIIDNSAGFGGTSKSGDFSYIMTGLAGNMNYVVRSYVEVDGELTYGNSIEFLTTSGPLPGNWLHYDDGINFDGIGLVDGGSWDVAIKIPSGDLGPYHGYRISKIKFFVREGDPIEYSVTIWEGPNPPVLEYIESVPFPQVNDWTEFTLADDIYINSYTDLWVGYWVQNQTAGLYPAGVDEGPAVTGFGDMISMDDGVTWEPLSGLNPPELNYNWNLQVYVTDSKGVEKQLNIKKPVAREVQSVSTGMGKKIVISEKQSIRNR